MPSGRTHDSITLWSLPLVAGLTLERTRSSSLTLIVSAGFLFSGLMFGPDLDIYSRQYRRWGTLRWIWRPYQRSMGHRSFLSHGPLVGTAIRILYLLIWLGLFGLMAILVAAIAAQMLGVVAHWEVFAHALIADTHAVLGRSLQRHFVEWITLAIGLELGALSHSMSDGAEFVYKRLILKHLNPTRSKSHIRKRQSDPLPETILTQSEQREQPRSDSHSISPTLQSPNTTHKSNPAHPSGLSPPPHLRRIDLPSFQRPARRNRD